MNTAIKVTRKCRSGFLLSFILSISIQVFSQSPADWRLEKMPAQLETDFALSALPSQLRAGATIYLLDPGKGYYVARKGSNGFICFVARTDWEWGTFSKNEAAAISYDAEGARTIFPVYMDVAAMRASGKFTAVQIRDTVIARIKKGIYKAPSRTGISYMLAPVMRAYTGTPADTQVVTMNVPHYMFYAPYLTNTDIGNIPDGQADGPVVINAGEMFLGAGKSPYGYIIVTVGKTEKAKIMAANKDLMDRLSAYKSYFKVENAAMHQ